MLRLREYGPTPPTPAPMPTCTNLICRDSTELQGLSFRLNPGSDFTAPALNQPSGGLRAGAVSVRERPSTDPAVKRPRTAQQHLTLCGGNYSHLASLVALVNGFTETLTLFPANGSLLPFRGGQIALTTGTGTPPLLSQPPFLRRPLPRLSLEAQGEASPGCQGNGSIVSTAGV